MYLQGLSCFAVSLPVEQARQRHKRQRLAQEVAQAGLRQRRPVLCEVHLRVGADRGLVQVLLRRTKSWQGGQS